MIKIPDNKIYSSIITTTIVLGTLLASQDLAMFIRKSIGAIIIIIIIRVFVKLYLERKKNTLSTHEIFVFNLSLTIYLFFALLISINL